MVTITARIVFEDDFERDCIYKLDFHSTDYADAYQKFLAFITYMVDEQELSFIEAKILDVQTT